MGFTYSTAHEIATMRDLCFSMLFTVSTVSMSGRSGALVKGQRPVSASTAFQVASPMTCPATTNQQAQEGLFTETPKERPTASRRASVAFNTPVSQSQIAALWCARSTQLQAEVCCKLSSYCSSLHGMSIPAIQATASIPTCWAHGWVYHRLQGDRVQYTCTQGNILNA